MPTVPSRTNARVEVEAGDATAVVFSADGKCLISGGEEGVCVWRVRDGKKLKTMDAGAVCSLAVSKDGRYIAAGTSWGEVLVWDTNTYKQVFLRKITTITAVDFSADSTRLVAASADSTAVVWDFLDNYEVFKLPHNGGVFAAKYSPQGDRIATATLELVRVWDGNDGNFLFDIEGTPMVPSYNIGLRWFENNLFVLSKNKIRKINASTGSKLSGWSAPSSGHGSRMVLSQHGKFIGYSAKKDVLFWDTLTHVRLCSIKNYPGICAIALSIQDRFLAIALQDGRIIITLLSCVTDIDSIRPSLLHPTLHEPELNIDDAVLDSWKSNQLSHAEGLLSTVIASCDSNYHALACRALLRARLGHLDMAIDDAEKSIKIQQSDIGYIAKCAILVAAGKIREGMRVCDIAVEHFYATHTTTFLLIKAVVLFMVGECDDAISRVDDLINTVQMNGSFCIVQTYMYLILGNKHMENGDHASAIGVFESARERLEKCTRRPPLIVSLISGWEFNNLWVEIQQAFCEALYSAGRTREACEAILEIVNASNEIQLVSDWVTGFVQRYLCAPGSCAHSPGPLLTTWARYKLKDSSWKEAIAVSECFTPSRFAIYRAVCGRLEEDDRLADAVACFCQMNRELALTYKMEGGQEVWLLEFKLRCIERLVEFGDAAVDALQYQDALKHYGIALSLNPTSSHLYAQRSKAYSGIFMWEKALDDANQAIRLNPASPLGYERRHVILHAMGNFQDAVESYKLMLLKLLQSSDPLVQARFQQYITPEQTEEAIRTAVNRAIVDSPSMLINTRTGRLLEKTERGSMFEVQPVFFELISSMTAEIDHDRIESEVKQYYRYATFSHTWNGKEPTLNDVKNTVVRDLVESPGNKKLQTFCEVAKRAGFDWAWSDTCCIDKGNNTVLQEALISMFRWYQGSSLTIVFLFDVPRLSGRGALAGSRWNTRSWTLQEYLASNVVRFYTGDWTPYLNIDMDNHKESPEIVSEMEQATGVSAQAFVELYPGLNNIREKLRMASTRETKKIEDQAYSLLGIFSASLPVTYGEHDKALARLLSLLLQSTGDTTILAWTGQSGSFNSCLPANIKVFEQLPTSHIPPSTTTIDLESVYARLRASKIQSQSVMDLYDRLCKLPTPSFSGRRMRLPCLRFQLGPALRPRNGSEQTFHARSMALGIVKIRTSVDLSRMNALYLVHPWIDYLLDHNQTGSFPEPALEGEDERGEEPCSVLNESFEDDTDSLWPPSSMSQGERERRMLCLIARLSEPFGALLLTPTRRHAEEYRRVATDCLITVRLEEMTPEVVDELKDSVQVLDVL